MRKKQNVIAPKAKNYQDAPKDNEAERAILASILMNAGLYLQAVGILTSDDFYLSGHRLLFRAMEQVSHSLGSNAIDPVTLGDGLKKIGRSWEDVGGRGYVSSLLDGIPRFSNIEHYARQVKEASVKRQIIEVCRDTAKTSYERKDLTAIEVLNRLQQKLQDLHQQGGAVKLENIGKSGILNQQLEEIIKRVEIPEEELQQKLTSYIPTPWPSVDHYGPVPRGGLCVLAARTSLGKSMMANQIATNAAKRGLKVGIFTMEDTRQNVVRRMIASEANIKLHKLNREVISKYEWGKITTAIDQIDQWGLSITSTINFTVDQLEAMARQEHRVNGIDLAILDYIQCFDDGDDSASRSRALKKIMRRLDEIANELMIGFIVVAQLNRGAEGATPQISHLKDAGIEEDAQVVAMLHRDRIDEEGKTKLLIVKNKNGRINTRGIELYFRGDHQKFTEVAKDEYQL